MGRMAVMRAVLQLIVAWAIGTIGLYWSLWLAHRLRLIGTYKTSSEAPFRTSLALGGTGVLWMVVALWGVNSALDIVWPMPNS